MHGSAGYRAPIAEIMRSYRVSSDERKRRLVIGDGSELRGKRRRTAIRIVMRIVVTSLAVTERIGRIELKGVCGR